MSFLEVIKTAKCKKCGFEAHIGNWKIVEKSGTIKLPEKTIKQYEEFVDKKNDTPNHMKILAKGLFRTLGQSGMMPYHQTKYICPRCDTTL